MTENISKREFLKILGAAAASLAAFPWIACISDKGTMQPSDNVRLGFIGVGDRGRALMLNILSLPKSSNVTIAAVCDDFEPNLQEAAKLSENPDVKSFSDYRKMLEMKDLDGVVICTPLHEHAGMAVDAMEAGMHVFCEKAMARTLPDIKKMYDTHISQNKMLQIGHQRLFDPRYLEAIEMIRAGALGKIGQIRAYWHRNNDWRRYVPEDRPELERKINWRHYTDYSAGLITELGSHQIQVANWVMDDVPVSVMGTGSIVYWKDGREVFDNVALIFSYKNGLQFIWDSMISNKKYGLEEQVMGDIAAMELESNKIYLETPPEAPGIRQLVHSIEKGLFETIPIGGATWVPETAVQYKGDYISEYYKLDETLLQMEAFIQYVRQGYAPEMLLKECYNASIWSILAEQAVYRGEKLSMPEEYIIENKEGGNE